MKYMYQGRMREKIIEYFFLLERKKLTYIFFSFSFSSFTFSRLRDFVTFFFCFCKFLCTYVGLFSRIFFLCIPRHFFDSTLRNPRFPNEILISEGWICMTRIWLDWEEFYWLVGIVRVAKVTDWPVNSARECPQSNSVVYTGLPVRPVMWQLLLAARLPALFKLVNYDHQTV